MPDNRQMWRIARLRPGETLAVLARLAPRLPVLIACDVRLIVTQEGAELYLPHFRQKPHRPEAEVLEVRSALGEAVAAVTGSTPLARDPVSANLDEMLDVAEAAAASLLTAATHTGPTEETDRFGSTVYKRVLIQGTLDEAAAATAAVVRRARYPTLATGRSGEDWVTLVELLDSPEAGATLDGLRAAVSGGLQVLAPQPTAGGVLWLSDGLSLDTASRDAAGHILAGLRLTGRLGPEEELAVLREPGRSNGAILTWRLPPLELRPAVEVLPLATKPPADRLSLRSLTIQPSTDAAERLAARILSYDFPLGYRVRLSPLPERLREDADVERLREEIEEREAEIALIRAMAAPQLRLLRFSDAQLPALVDGLRRMPPAMMSNAGLTFATAHAAGRIGPAHFVLYDPARVAFEGRLPEYYWRAKTEDRPIGYWLDPHAAAAMSGAPGEPLIFVPVRSRIEPPIASFGGDLGQTMRLVLANLFADASAVLDRLGARPAYVFSPPAERDFDLEVEVLNLSEFAPIHLRLRWINDHILVRSPQGAAEKALGALAEDLWEGAAARTLRLHLRQEVQEVEADWDDAADALSSRIGSITSALTHELREVALRATRAHAFLAAARLRIEEIDKGVAGMQRSLSSAEALATATAQLAKERGNARLVFADDLLSEIEAGRRTMDQAEVRITTELKTIEGLMKRLGL